MALIYICIFIRLNVGIFLLSHVKWLLLLVSAKTQRLINILLTIFFKKIRTVNSRFFNGR